MQHLKEGLSVRHLHTEGLSTCLANINTKQLPSHSGTRLGISALGQARGNEACSVPWLWRRHGVEERSGHHGHRAEPQRPPCRLLAQERSRNDEGHEALEG